MRLSHAYKMHSLVTVGNNLCTKRLKYNSYILTHHCCNMSTTCDGRIACSLSSSDKKMVVTYIRRCNILGDTVTKFLTVLAYCVITVGK